MKTKQEAKKEALAYLEKLSDQGHYSIRLINRTEHDICFVVRTAGVDNKYFPYEPLEKDAPYKVWDGDTKPKRPRIYYYSGNGMEFYLCDDYLINDDCLEWDHCEKMEGQK